jgi:hypothetical protein
VRCVVPGRQQRKTVNWWAWMRKIGEPHLDDGSGVDKSSPGGGRQQQAAHHHNRHHRHRQTPTPTTATPTTAISNTTDDSVASHLALCEEIDCESQAAPVLAVIRAVALRATTTTTAAAHPIAGIRVATIDASVTATADANTARCNGFCIAASSTTCIAAAATTTAVATATAARAPSGCGSFRWKGGRRGLGLEAAAAADHQHGPAAIVRQLHAQPLHEQLRVGAGRHVVGDAAAAAATGLLLLLLLLLRQPREKAREEMRAARDVALDKRCLRPACAGPREGGRVGGWCLIRQQKWRHWLVVQQQRQRRRRQRYRTKSNCQRSPRRTECPR